MINEDKYPYCEGLDCNEEALVELYELYGTGDHFYCIVCAIIRLDELNEKKIWLLIPINYPTFECECENHICNEKAIAELFELDGIGDHRYCINCAIERLSELKKLETTLKKIGRKVGVTSVAGIR